MKQLSRVTLGLMGGLAVLSGIGWAGLRVPPKKTPVPVDKTQDFGIVNIPTDLPMPVQRYLRVTVGDSAPRVDSLVAYGRARAKFGIWMPLRYRLTH